MESTSCGKECPFVKQGFCQNHKECPNHIETWWIPGEGKNPVKLEDCAPKRLVLQQQVLQARLDLTTQALVQQRNEYNQLSGYLKTLVEMGKVVIQKKEEIENEKDINLIANEP